MKEKWFVSKPLYANCPYINQRHPTCDREMLLGVIKAEEIHDSKVRSYNPFNAYCFLARYSIRKKFNATCPSYECPYRDGKIHAIRWHPKTSRPILDAFQHLIH